MKIADSARTQLEALLASSERGSMASLMLGYTYDEGWNKHPHIDVAIIPPDVLAAMKQGLAPSGEELIHEIDGLPFALPVTDDDGLFEGHVLVWGAEGFSLIRASS